VKYETERNYLAQNESIDNAGAWANGSMYGLGTSDDGVGDDEIMNITPSGQSTSWADAFKSAIPVLASVYQQKQLTQMNLARINRNQPPLTAQEYATVYQPPSAQVQFGATSDAKRMMLYAALGIAALVGLRAAKVI
jgi:hypothetical protein